MTAPNLYLMETRLRAAWEALSNLDPEGEMTAEEAEAFLRQYVDPSAALERRDEFVDFVHEMEDLAKAKRARAGELQGQANAIDEGVARMEQAACRTMQFLGVDRLKGLRHTLKLRTNPPSVEVVNESRIPPEYFTVPPSRDDDDLAAIVTLRAFVVALLEDNGITAEQRAAIGKDAARLVAGAEHRRKRLDKTKVKAAWKEHGGDAVEVPIAQLPESEQQAARARNALQGNHRNVARVPVVPGCEMRTGLRLEYK